MKRLIKNFGVFAILFLGVNLGKAQLYDFAVGGQVDTGKGIFQFNAVESYKIENGEIGQELRDVSLSGNILETLKNVDAIGNDFKFSVGFCGKNGQIAPVGDGGPNTRILNAMVGGSN